MFPPRTPVHVQNAHKSIVSIYDFLARYEGWVANAGADGCDFALGNPQNMPLEGFVTALRNATTPQNPAWYAYKTNEKASREIIRASLGKLTGFAYPAENIFLTNGATGAFLVLMRALIGPKDEVIFNNPPWFFYEGMILNSGGIPIAVDVEPDTFEMDVDGIERAITENTRFVIVNSPNNPTGRVYSPDLLLELGRMLERTSKKIGRPIYLVSDEVYRAVVYDDAIFHSPTKFYKNSIMVYSYGKTLLTPGQRIGYLALSPQIENAEELRTILYSSQILCGWAMTSALMQHALPELEKLSLDVKALQARRDRFVQGLRECCYEVRIPQGAFYITPKSPIENDLEFSEILAKQGVFCLPGSVVAMRGYLRASITASDEMIDRALPIFAAARKQIKSVRSDITNPSEEGLVV
jgi:aspartate aminotransferase